MKVCIIGAGASGLMCAGYIAKHGHDVTVFDGNEKAGKKIYITGKGRCNFTNVCDNQELLSNVVRGQKFLYSAINKFSSYDTLAFFDELGMEFIVERGNRAFPKSNKASDVTKALLKHCQGVEFRYSERVVSIVPYGDSFEIKTEKDKYIFESVIVATGGKSYEATGSRGEGYTFAKMLGHNIVDLKPALVPIELKDTFLKDLQGISLKNVTLHVQTAKNNIQEFGELMFTDRGITGPIVLTVSSLINREKVENIYIDLKPALSEQQLEKRLLREFEESKNKNVLNVIRNLLPLNLVNVFLSQIQILPEKKCNNITVLERKKIINQLKCFTLSFKSLYNLNVGVVTSGGVDLNQINPRNMESKIHKNLYFIGEVLDIDAFTGGFNLQVAFSTAVACADSFK